MNYKQFINDWKINKSLLAKKMDMPLGTFSNKFSNNETYKFTIAELDYMKTVLKEMVNDFTHVEFYN